MNKLWLLGFAMLSINLSKANASVDFFGRSMTEPPVSDYDDKWPRRHGRSFVGTSTPTTTTSATTSTTTTSVAPVTSDDGSSSIPTITAPSSVVPMTTSTANDSTTAPPTTQPPAPTQTEPAATAPPPATTSPPAPTVSRTPKPSVQQASPVSVSSKPAATKPATTSPQSSSSSQNQAETKASAEGAKSSGTWMVVGVGICGVCVMVIGAVLVMKAKQKRNSFNDSFDRKRDPSVVFRHDMEDPSPNSNNYAQVNDSSPSTSSSTSNHATIPMEDLARNNSVVTRCSAVSSVCSLADSDYVNYQSSLPNGGPSTYGCSFVTSLGSDTSFLDSSEFGEDEQFSMSMVSIDDVESSASIDVDVEVLARAQQQQQEPKSSQQFIPLTSCMEVDL